MSRSDAEFEAFYRAEIESREKQLLPKSPICSCQSVPIKTPGLSEFLWDEDYPEHGLNGINN